MDTFFLDATAHPLKWNNLEKGRQQWRRKNPATGKEWKVPLQPIQPWTGCFEVQQHSHQTTNQGFLFIHRVKLWFVFVFAVCSVSILNNKPVRRPDGATSLLIQSRPCLEKWIGKTCFYLREDCAGGGAPICSGWWSGWGVINAVITSHQNLLDDRKNVP